MKFFAGWLRTLAVLVLGGWALNLGATAQTTYEHYTFSTLAGPSEQGLGWYDGAASAANFYYPCGIARDGAGNLYVADTYNHTIRKMTPAGQVTTLAGSAGNPGSADGVGNAARFNNPRALALDPAGNLYVADSLNHTIRKITPAGLVSTVAGMAGTAGKVNGTGRAARFNNPAGMGVDSAGNLYVADTYNHTIRKVTPAGAVSTLAGAAGFAGSANGTGINARFNYPFGVAVDPAGNVFVADTYNNTIRKVTAAGGVSTLAGAVGASGSADGTGNAARFNNPFDLTADNSGNVYVADAYNHTIRKVTAAGVVSTLAGAAGASGSTDGTGNTARFDLPLGVVVDSSSILYVADTYNHIIRKVTPLGTVTTLAGAVPWGGADGTGSSARFWYPQGMAMDRGGNLYVAESRNHTVRKITPVGVVTTLAGSFGLSGSDDGLGSAARFNGPIGVAVDSSGNVFVADTHNQIIRRVTPAGMVSTLAGSVTNAGSADGTGSAARFNTPCGLTVDSSGNVFVADTYNHTIRKITLAGGVSTFAGAVGVAGTNNGTGSAARFAYPVGLAVDPSDNIYVADSYNHTIRKITPAGMVTTLAGTPGITGSMDGTSAVARFNGPYGVGVDASGNILVADTFNYSIRKITPAGGVTTLAGTPGAMGCANGTDDAARFNTPYGLAADSSGTVYVVDSYNHSIRKGYPALPDRAGVDLAMGAVGVTRHLSVATATTTSWSWDFVRYPATSSARLSGANTLNPTFTPDVPDLYVVRFQGRDSQGRLAVSTLSIGSDLRPPTLAFTSPKAGQRCTNAVLAVTGTASDDVALANVWCQLNGGTWIPAAGTTNWSASLPLAAAGTNALRAYARDAAGNASATNSLSFLYVPSARVTVQIVGNGTVTPNYNGQLLEVGKTYKLLATPRIGFAFSGWSGDLATNAAVLTFVLRDNLALTASFADAVNPTVAITAPRLNQRWSNAVFTVTGTAKDNAGLAGVWCQLNNNSWTQASGTTNWSTALTLAPGTNTIRAFARDAAGRASLTNSVKCIYVLSDRLQLLTTGQGTVTPNYSNALLELGRNYTLTARPGAGSVFSNWMDTAGNVLAETPALAFTMRSNLALQATFIPNPFQSAQGNYAGLFYDTNSVTVTNSGLFTVTLGNQGSFSSKLQMAGISYGLAGRFSVGGNFSGAIPRTGRSPLLVQLHLDLQGDELLTGQVSDGAWTSELAANRAVYSRTNPAPLGGKKFTLVLPGGQADAAQPGGFGLGRVTVDPAGNVVFSGKLSDGTVVSQTTFLSKQGQWPLYQSLYAGKGHLLGWLTINTNDPASDLSGLLSWIKLPQPLAKLYPAGFEFPDGVEAVGSLFSFTNGVPTLNWTRGALLLEGGNLSQTLTNSVQIAPNLKVSSSNNVSLTITNSTGWFQGRVVDPVTGKPIVVNGTLLQKQNTGYGYFLGTNTSGRVYLGPL